MKVKETDAAVISVDARLAMSSGDIMMKTAATIEWRLQFRSNAAFDEQEWIRDVCR